MKADCTGSGYRREWLVCEETCRILNITINMKKIRTKKCVSKERKKYFFMKSVLCCCMHHSHPLGWTGVTSFIADPCCCFSSYARTVGCDRNLAAGFSNIHWVVSTLSSFEILFLISESAMSNYCKRHCRKNELNRVRMLSGLRHMCGIIITVLTWHLHYN